MAGLVDLIERHTRKDGLHPTAIRPLSLFRCSTLTRPTPSVFGSALCMLARGRKRVVMGDQTFFYDPAHFLLASVDMPIVGQIIESSPHAPFLGLRISLDISLINELIVEGGLTATKKLSTVRSMCVSAIDPPLLDAVERLLDLLDSPEDILVLAPLVLREITYRLLVGEQGELLRQIAAGDSQARRIARSIQWLKCHFAEPVRIERLANEAHMSPSAFHHHFKVVTGMSPLQYQKQLRLHEARRLIFGEGLDAAAAGYRVGYESPSHFSREYRRLFGRPPGRDLVLFRDGSKELADLDDEPGLESLGGEG